jgi:hypothetical protein
MSASTSCSSTSLPPPCRPSDHPARPSAPLAP